jgi:hypothetical protein
LKNIVVSMCNTLLSESVVRALRETGDFRPEPIPPDQTGRVAAVCEALGADVVVMEVSRLRGFSLAERLMIADGLRGALPGCRTALICDENADPQIAGRVKAARQEGRIDAFFYASVTPAYLTAMLDAL